MPSLSMVFDVLAIDRASAVFDRVGASAERAGASVEAASTTTANAGSRIAAGLGLATAAVAVLSAKLAGDYQQNVTKLVTTAGEAQSNLAKVSQGMLDMSTQVGVGANDLAKGMYTVESAGFHGANALNVLKAAAQGERQEQADLGKTTDALTTILHDYNMAASQSADVMSKLVTAVSTGKTTLEDFTGSLHSVTPLAAALHVPLQDILGSLAAMTASGESADQATQNMADALRHLQSPTATMSAELAQVGITSSQLATDLGTKGLAGTMQEIEQAILQHIDPATQKVLLPAFNQSKTAAQDLATMIGQMPPQLAKLSQGLLDGSTNIADYRKAVQGMGGDAGASGLQFLSLYKNADGFNQILKEGGPAAQVFTSALQKSVGDVAGLTVALQLTGEHADTVNTNIQKIAKSSGDAKGNIKGWDDVQGNFNQQLAEAGASLEKMAIEFGQKLLPALTDGVHFVNSTVIPGIEHLGSAAGATAHWFGELPGPVKDFALALAALRVADMIGVFDKLSTSAGAVRKAFSGFGAEVSGLQMWSQWQVAAGNAEAPMSRFSAALQLAGGRLSGLRGAASSLMGLFGGPWGLAIAGAVVGLSYLSSQVAKHDAEIKKATDDVTAWNKAIALGSGQQVVTAANHLDDLRQQIAAVRKEMEALSGAGASTGGSGRFGAANQQGAALEGLKAKYSELTGELNKGTAAWQKQLDAMSPVQEAQARVDLATQALTDAQKHNAANSPAVINAQRALADANSYLATETGRATDAQKTQLQQMADNANSIIANADAQAQAQRSLAQFNQALATYASLAKPGTQDQLDLADATRQYAQTQADAAVAQAKANGVTDTGSVSQQAYLKALQDAANQMGVSTPASITQLIQSLSGAIGATGQTIGAFQHLGQQSDEEKQKLQDLGHVIVTLPDGSVVITADTSPAETEIRDLLQFARQQSITYRSNLPDLVPGVSGGGLMGHAATGGWITGPGTGTSDSVPMWLSNGEFVVNAASAAQHSDLLEAINSGMGRMAAGGWVGLSPGGTWPVGSGNVKVSIDVSQAEGVIAQMYKAAAAAAFAPGAPTAVSANAALGKMLAGGYGWGGGAEWNALYALWQRESGWRNTAQNPTSTAYGIPQFLNSTWASVGYPKTSDAAIQIAAGLKYIAQRFHDPIGAWAHETRFGWYDNGGYLMPGLTLAYNGTGKPERIRTAEQEAALGGSGPVVIHMYDADNHLIGTMHGVAEHVTTAAFNASSQRGDYNG